MSENKRYPKRSAEVVKKENLGEKLIRIHLKLEHTNELPSSLRGRHIKLHPFKDDYKKSYTISSHTNDLISLDINQHPNGKASLWSKKCLKGDKVDIHGPKIKTKIVLDLDSKKVLLVTDLTGFSTMEYLLSILNQDCVGNLYVLSDEEIQIENNTKITIHFVDSLNFKEIFTEDVINGHVILSSSKIKEIINTIEPSKLENINLKAYWKN